MLILLWLVPPAVVTLVAMVVAGWIGREGRGEISDEVAVERLARALEKETPRHPVIRTPSPAAQRPADHSTGVAVRRRAETRRV